MWNWEHSAEHPGEASGQQLGLPGLEHAGLQGDACLGDIGTLSSLLIPRPLVCFNFAGMLLEFQTLHYSYLPPGNFPLKRKTQNSRDDQANTTAGVCLGLS